MFLCLLSPSLQRTAPAVYSCVCSDPWFVLVRAYHVLLVPHGGRPAAALNPNTPPPPPKGLVDPDHIWSRYLAKGAGNFCKHMVGGKISFLPHVWILKMLSAPWRIQICMQNMKKNFSSLTSPPVPPPNQAPQTWLLGPDPPGGKFFSNKAPQMCVQNDQCEEGIILRYGYPGPQPGSPPPPPPEPCTPPPFTRQMFKGCWGLGLLPCGALCMSHAPGDVLTDGGVWDNTAFYNDTGMKTYPRYFMGGGYLATSDIVRALGRLSVTIPLQLWPVEVRVCVCLLALSLDPPPPAAPPLILDHNSSQPLL